VRLFVAAVPPPGILDAIAALDRPAREGVRWTTRPQWHVTLRFLGEQDDPGPIARALDATPLAAAEATVGPVVEALFPGVVGLRVAGLDDLAAGVAAAASETGVAPDLRPFHGHVTLARLDRRRGRGHDRPRARPAGLTGAPLSARFPVDEVHVVRSHLGPGGAHYEDVHIRPLKA
jgi:RNA 2',3'-cyclic 3'-phosphodiesterase